MYNTNLYQSSLTVDYVGIVRSDNRGVFLVQRSCEEHGGGWQGSGPIASQVIYLSWVNKVELATDNALSGGREGWSGVNILLISRSKQ